MKLIFGINLFLYSILLLSSCKKHEGPGGSSAITGVLSTQLYNTSDSLIATYPKANEDLFIIYGEGNTVYSDKITSSYDGSFKFDYLEKGKYSIYVYEDCAACPEGKQAKLITTEITKNKSTVDLGTIGIKKIKDAGNSKITGNIHVLNYNSSGVFLNEGIGVDIDVYIIYGTGSTSYSDRIKSNYDGTFSFPDLAKGNYTIYAYSDCSSCASGKEAVKIDTNIINDNSSVNVGQITIIQ